MRTPIDTLRVLSENIRTGAPPAASPRTPRTLREEEHEGEKMVFGVWRKVDGAGTAEEHTAAAEHHKARMNDAVTATKASMAKATEAEGAGDHKAAAGHAKEALHHYARSLGHQTTLNAHRAAAKAGGGVVESPSSDEEAIATHARTAHAKLASALKGKADKAIAKAKPAPIHKTYDAAMGAVQDHLAEKGWTVAKGLKTPHATSPDGEVRLWFHGQSVHYTSKSEHGEKGMRDHGNARSATGPGDMRDKTVAEIVKDINPDGLKGQESIRPENIR